MRGKPLFLPALSLALVLVACGGPSAQSPSSAIDAYVKALEAKDYKAAYALMSSRYRRDHTYEEFKKMMEESPADVKETAARLKTASRSDGNMDITAELKYGQLDDRLRLVWESGEWRVAQDPLAFYPQDSPERALRSFLRAVLSQRYDIVLRFVPNEYRKHMTVASLREEFEGERRDENLEKLRLLMDGLENPIEKAGDTARMPFGDRYEVKFVREDGLWKIEDLY